MAWTREELRKSINDNDLSIVIFADPFGSVTRLAKRNLLVSSFVALLIAVLGLEVTGFLGLQATDEGLGNGIAQGLACLLVVYFLVSFLFHAYIDYTAWRFERERQQTQPYLELIQTLESKADITAEQIKNACSGIENLLIEDSMQSQVHAQKLLKSSLGQLQSIDKHSMELLEEARPLMASWGSTIRGMERLNRRLLTRFVSLWILDILLPISLGLGAIYRTYAGLALVGERILI